MFIDLHLVFCILPRGAHTHTHRQDGTKIITRIKKVSGDRDVFVKELRALLNLGTPANPIYDSIRVRDTNGTIEVKTWLAGLGF
jgi:hypothetical protein